METVTRRPLLPLLLVLASTVSCTKKTGSSGDGPAASSTPAASSSASAVVRRKLPRQNGSPIAREIDGKALYLADEDAGVVRRVALPVVQGDQGTELKVAGPPAQVLSRDGEVLVTVRDPAQVLVLKDGPEGLSQVASIAVAPDAWGMALSPDESTLVVTSAWSRTVSVIDLAKRQVQKTIEVAREPRGVVITPDGKKAYVTHLMGSAVTRIDLAGAASSAHPVALAADPARAPRRGEPTASLAFAPVLSEDGSRLMVPRHALGTVSATPTTDWRGFNLIWWGSATVDVMMLRDESALMPARASTALVGRFGGAVGMPEKPTSPEEGALPTTSHEVFVQPRDAILRRSTRTLLIASEGFDWVTEHDADALNPGLASAASYGLGDGYLTGKSKAPSAETGSAPQGIALSVDENEAYVWARGSREVFSVPLQPDPLNLSPSAKRERKYEKTVAGPFAEPFAKDAAAGRKLFYLARDQVMSGGLACSGCHPDGRDDGFVWHEARSKRKTTGADDASVFVATPAALFEPEDGGKARRTPMLAGRVGPAGPYGWHAQSKDLDARLIEGFGLHRWNPAPSAPTAYERANRLGQLAAFLRKGLRPPPRDASPLTAEEEKGRVLFENDKTQCKSCHPSDSDYTTRVAMPLRSPLPTRDGFATDDAHFRVPSLLFVGGLGPYYHDGSVKTLPELIEKNGNRMGDTSGLSADDRAALVAYLRRL